MTFDDLVELGHHGRASRTRGRRHDRATGGYTSEDLDRLPGLPPHTELIDGGLHFVSPQKNFHSLIVDLLVWRLRQTCPPSLALRREMSIIIGPRQRPEPDLVVILADAITSLDQTWFPVEAVVLAVEVVSPGGSRKPRAESRSSTPLSWSWRAGPMSCKESSKTRSSSPCPSKSIST